MGRFILKQAWGMQHSKRVNGRRKVDRRYFKNQLMFRDLPRVRRQGQRNREEGYLLRAPGEPCYPDVTGGFTNTGP